MNLERLERHAMPSVAITLHLALQVAVPLWIERRRDWTPEQRADRARECADVVATYGDLILFRTPSPRGGLRHGKRRMGTAEAFDHLAEGLALLAFQPGGVTAFGLHFEVPPEKVQDRP